jgi:hypothetical protein
MSHMGHNHLYKVLGKGDLESTQVGIFCMAHSIFFGRLDDQDQQNDSKESIHVRITSCSYMAGNILRLAYTDEMIQCQIIQCAHHLDGACNMLVVRFGLPSFLI